MSYPMCMRICEDITWNPFRTPASRIVLPMTSYLATPYPMCVGSARGHWNPSCRTPASEPSRSAGPPLTSPTRDPVRARWLSLPFFRPSMQLLSWLSCGRCRRRRGRRSIRGTCTGLIRAFDRHMNLLLVDVREDYTALVPDREPPKPGSKRQEQRRRRPQEGAPSPDPLQGAGGGGMGVELGSGDSRGNQPADVGGAGSARGLSTGVGGEGEEGGWGGSVSWGGGGSVSWGGGGSGAEEVEGVCHPHGMTPARDAQRKGAPSAEEVAAGDSGGGGDGGGSHTFGGGGGGSGGGGGGDVGRGRGAVAPAAAGSSGAAAELVNTESVVGVRNEAVPSSHPRETPCSTETTRGLGSEQQPTTGVFLAEKEEANDGGPGAGRDSRIGGVQPPPGGAERADRTGVGGQGQRGGFGQPPVEGGGPDGQEGGGGSGTTEVMKKKSTRKSRGRGPWRGELVPVRRRRFLKQLMIRGDNVVMIWEESPKR